VRNEMPVLASCGSLCKTQQPCKSPPLRSARERLQNPIWTVPRCNSSLPREGTTESGPARNAHGHGGGHGHNTHGLMDDSIKHSHEGIRAVLRSLAVLGLAGVAQTIVFLANAILNLLGLF
jgi:hypothetical protein